MQPTWNPLRGFHAAATERSAASQRGSIRHAPSSRLVRGLAAHQRCVSLLPIYVQTSSSGCLMEPFEIVSEITEIETIAVENSIRDLARLRKHYGQGRWRKLKGVAMIRLRNGRVREAELHWYEAHGIGRKEIKRQRYLR